ncbi:MAG: cupin domain-containing protein [Candidatus Omnitrophota bacterium]|nr:cupin domain-containing protein [Candidatus Omnitrophota bacterium]MBU1929264.1 cupin domain-containing protein [Candidatus Omnitrophota bacterium]MBU2035286.1 cupin domain-containing protein [Candidatus Omnitrophota bacterium]MBU2221184.1 cupin domain-containing protein [Candidatus Omnitrophota bacterium]
MKDKKPTLVKLTRTDEYQRLLNGTPYTAGIKSGRVTLKPRESVGEHKTQSKEEVIIILEGEADVYVDGTLKFTAGIDNLVYIPPETSHDIRNSRSQNLRYIYITAPVLP